MPEIIIVKNEAEAGEIYGRCVADLIKAKPNAVLGWPLAPARWQPIRRLPRSCMTSRSTSPR